MPEEFYWDEHDLLVADDEYEYEYDGDFDWYTEHRYKDDKYDCAG